MSDPPRGSKEPGLGTEYSSERAFLALDVLPEAAQAFGSTIRSLEQAIEDGDIVVDTNVLLLPYGAGADSLDRIVKTYNTVAKDGRLFLPAQVAREFVRNRPAKIGELYQGIADKISALKSPDTLSYPILSGIPEFDALNKAVQEAVDIRTEIKRANSALLKKIRSWEWNDPVSEAYRRVFTQAMFVEPALDRQVALAELRRRHELSIPPGYKDASKDDYGVGDFLIWKAILWLGQSRKRDLIFVSGDEKSDWQHRAGGSGFLPRFELLDEYRRASGGKAFYIVSFSKFLELLKGDQTLITEIRAEELRLISVTEVSVSCPHCDGSVEWRLAEPIGSSALPRCPSCGRAFHLHRTRQGITVHRPSERTMTDPEANSTPYDGLVAPPASTSVECPVCRSVSVAQLGSYPGATAWCRCEPCKMDFPVHRRSDGSAFAGQGSWRLP